MSVTESLLMSGSLTVVRGLTRTGLEIGEEWEGGHAKQTTE
jgi:hypothetical protein